MSFSLKNGDSKRVTLKTRVTVNLNILCQCTVRPGVTVSWYIRFFTFGLANSNFILRYSRLEWIIIQMRHEKVQHSEITVNYHHGDFLLYTEQPAEHRTTGNRTKANVSLWIMLDIENSDRYMAVNFFQ